MAKDCPQAGNATRVIVADKETESEEQCWIRVGVLTAEPDSEQTAVSTTGPTYKVDVIIEGQSTSRQWLSNLAGAYRDATQVERDQQLEYGGVQEQNFQSSFSTTRCW